MKRYANRRAKPKLSQWCATKSYPYEICDDVSKDVWRRVQVSGHNVCLSQRWHDPDHLECCARPDERESYACQCPCHPPGSWAHGGPR